jgi:glycosyltransferase involved in cell wall biosynthesis
MNRGGVENWLMHVLRNIDRRNFVMDFVTFSRAPSDFEQEILSLGSQIHSCFPSSHPWRQVLDFKAILKQYGPYNVVHSHDQTWNGPLLSIAKTCGVPVRIAHSHNDIRQSRPKGQLKTYYSRLSINISKRFATHGFACSRLAAESYFGKNWEEDSRCRVFYCGEDFAQFSQMVDVSKCRRELGIPENATVVGHVGSFRNKLKNQVFLVRIAKDLVQLDDNVCFLLVGDGELRHEIEKEVAREGLRERIVFTGARSDVPRLMLGAMDIFIFPSLSEGLGIVLLEAQAAGLPCIISDVVPSEADIIPYFIERISLDKSPKMWAYSVMNWKNSKLLISKEQALKIVKNSQFNIKNTIKDLEVVYSSF